MNIFPLQYKIKDTAMIEKLYDDYDINISINIWLTIWFQAKI